MVIQIVNLSFQDVFRRYSRKYNIFREVFQSGLLALEIRNATNSLAESVHKIILGENEIAYKSVYHGKKFIDILIPGSIKNIKELSRRILSSGDEDLGYKIAGVIKNYEEYDNKSYTIGEKNFNFAKSYVMGILNVTPDSFSDGGKYIKIDKAVSYALQMLDEGADIIDIGGESSRPGSDSVSAEEEAERVIPALNKILELRPDTIISVDTTKQIVAEEALKNGAKIINDISALNFEPDMLNTIKKYNASLILMHMKGNPKTMQNEPFYEDVVTEVYDFLFNKLQIVNQAGIKNIIIDPGIGFGKLVEHNFELIRRLEDFKCIGYPILIGVSRKTFIGKTLALNVGERDTATAAIESVAIKNGARIIRTHNVKFGVQVSKLLNNIL